MNSNFDFDLGLGSGRRPNSLNDQKNKASSFSSTATATATAAAAQSRPARQQQQPAGKPTSWTHQPAPGFTNAPASMVGDIFGKSWGSTAPAVSTTPINVVNKNPNLFGDLVSSAMGGKVNSSTNVPLKNANPSNKSSFSMGHVANSLPKTAASASTSPANGGGYGNFGTFSGGFNSNANKSNVSDNNGNGTGVKGANLGGPSLRNMGGAGGGMGTKKDPFGSLVDLASKPSANPNAASTKPGGSRSVVEDGFGDFQKAPKPSTTNATFGSTGFGDFGMPAKATPDQSSTSNDPFEVLFPSAGGDVPAYTGVGVQQPSEIDDWGTAFGGGDHDGGVSTTELEGLPPPPAGVSASAAKSKGMDNYKQGQYPDAIKWLSWAVILLEKGSDSAAVAEVLSSRASCYKEVGEYKKAVADCTKVLDQDDGNVSVLVQRALLYESMEKYRLGAEDLRTVLKFDPGNRVARSTIHRLTKLAD